MVQLKGLLDKGCYVMIVDLKVIQLVQILV